MQLRVCRIKKGIRNNLNRWSKGDLEMCLALFAEHEVGGFRKITAVGSTYFLRLGERTEQTYRGRSPGTRYMVVATRVDIHGAPIDDKTHFVPDGFLRSNVHVLPAAIPGETVKERVGNVLSAGAGAAEVGKEVGKEVVPDTPMVPLIGDDFNNTVFGAVKPPRQQPRNYTPTFASYTPIFGKQRESERESDEMQDEMQERESDESDEEPLKDKRKRKRAAPKKRRCVLCCPIVLRTCTHTCHFAALNT